MIFINMKKVEENTSNFSFLECLDDQLLDMVHKVLVLLQLAIIKSRDAARFCRSIIKTR